MISIDNLRSFCAVVEARSFRAAATRRHVSQPAISQQIKSLETGLGCSLVDRRTRQPTPAGDVLYNRARRILNDLDSLPRELADLDGAPGHDLRVGTSDTTTLYYLPPFVRTFAHIMPDTHMVVVNRPSDAIADQVARGELDLGIVTLPVTRSELDQTKLFDERFVLVVPKTHPLAVRRRVRLTALRDEPFVLLQAETRTGAILRDHFVHASFEPRVVLDSGSFEVVKRYVAEGVGLSFLPEIVLTESDDALATIRVPGLPSVSIGAIWRREAYQTRAQRAFLDMLA